ncbi:hypothetical protein FS935_22760 [Metabacillus litoralis]|uniref:Uncharacterized protein n=1 Tax=Metabacillus litoralis TaxID=152268 RepID=A0A5C6V461_9BACI|nr:hypothetical protein [Metabacillus litoralis]TXC78488.1 hypothetical protein FS935_22760 [Metabacillus litoralis]
MKNNTFAIYNGEEYSAGIKTDGRIILRSHDTKDELNGFEEKSMANQTIYVKYVSSNEIEQLYHKRIKAHYKGYEFEVVDQKDKMISIITMVGDYKVWENIGMKCIDKGVYQKWVSKDDVIIVVEKEKIS